jgi:hypothetical protein
MRKTTNETYHTLMDKNIYKNPSASLEGIDGPSVAKNKVFC